MFGAFIFSAYIIYDTQMIMKHLSAEEYVIGVINLYMDIINLFVKILKLLNTLKEQGEKREKNKRKQKKVTSQNYTKKQINNNNKTNIFDVQLKLIKSINFKSVYIYY